MTNQTQTQTQPAQSAQLVNPFQPQTPSISAPLGYKDVQMPAVHPDIAKQIINSRPMPTIWQPPPVLQLAASTVQGAPSIVEMARSLKNDPSLMFEFVYNNIEHTIGMGLAKGPLGTLINGSGNSFDLCSLLAALLRQAGFVANYEVGQIQITLAQAVAWLGITDNNIATASTLLANAGVPVSIVGTAPNEELLLTHCWLKVNIGTVATPNWVVMDPSFKTYTTKPSIDLAAATGYSAATFLSQARAGYSIDPAGNWVQNINRANIRSELTTLSMNLANFIKSNNPGATTADIIGGRQIVPVTLPIFAATLPYEAVGDVPVEFTGDFSTAYKTTVRLVYFGFDVTLTSDQLSGHRLTLLFVPSGSNWIPTLALDGVTVATGTTVGSFFTYNLQITVTHQAYPNTGSDQTFFQFTEGPRLVGGGAEVYYLVGSSFGPAGKGSFDYHTALQLQNEFDAGGAGEFVLLEPVLGERMAAYWASFSAQLSCVADLINRMTATNFTNHHLIGLVSYRIEPGSKTFSNIDIQSEISSWSNLNSANTNLAAAGILRSMHVYALEMLAIQQQTTILPNSNEMLAVSTTRLLDTATSLGAKIFKGTAANWTSDVVPALTNYNAGDLSNLYTSYLAIGENVVLPQNNGYLFNGHWTLRGWSIIRPLGGAGGIIFGSYAGGGGRGWWPAKPKMKRKDCEDEDGANTRTGDLNLSPGGGLTVGSGDMPYSLPFLPSYDSRVKLENGPLGLGWTHNWAARVQLSPEDFAYSDGFLGLGSESPISAVASITQLFVNLDILSDTTLPVDKLVIAHVSDQWWVDQMTNNIVTVQMPNDEDLVFTVLPDGTYQSPRDNASTLTQLFANYTLTTPQKVAYAFNKFAKQQLLSITYPSGVVISLTYNAGKLETIDNGMGRTLTFTYTGNFISSVSDGTGRSVSYTVDGANQLTQITDALGQNYTFQYDSPGRLQKYFKPKNPTSACLTNTFDSLGRVQSQVDILGHTRNFYIAGSRSEIVDPVGNSSITYFDAVDNPVKDIDALGNVTLREFDGLGRMVKSVMPEGNFTTWLHDANNNVLTETEVAKPGSALANIVRQNTYDPLWNKVQVATDGRGNSTVNTYDATGNLVKIERPPATVGGPTPTVLMTWNGRGQMLTRIDETGIVMNLVYDAVTEKLLSVVNDFGVSRLNLTTNLGYDSAGNVTSVQDPLGRTTTFIFDSLRRPTRRTETAPFSYQTRYVYDDNSNLLSVRRQTGIVATPWQIYSFTYTLSDKKRRMTDPAGNATLWFYDGADRLRRVRDAENREYVYGYDVLNRTRTVTDPTGVISETRLYSDNGKLRSIKDARGFVTTYSRDGFDRLNRTNYPDGTFERNQVYDANGNVLNSRTRSGSTIIRTFDALNRVATKLPQGQAKVTYAYDLANRLLSAKKPVVAGDPSTGLFQQVWDSAGRFVREIYPDLKEVSFELDSNSNVTKILYPDGYFLDRAYDQLNRLSTIKLNGDTASAATFAYDQLSRRTSLGFSSGASVAYAPQLNEDLTALAHSFVGSNLALAYGFNTVHQITGQTFSDDTYSWHPGAAASVVYDPASNTNQYPLVGGVAQSYNANGCLTSDGVWSHGYDTENHLLSSNKPGTSLAFVYDPFHRQAEKAATVAGTAKTRYIYSGWQRLADYDSVTGVLQNRYVYGTRMDEPLIQVSSAGVLTFLHANHQGSIIATTDSTGAVTNKNAYGPFGEITALAGTTFGYTSQRLDSESGLYYYKRRYFSSATGRFLQPDPIGYQIEVACGCSCAGGCGDDAKASELNLYSYVENDPLNRTDPLGLLAGPAVGAGAVAVGPVGVVVGLAVAAVVATGIVIALVRSFKVKTDVSEDDCKANCAEQVRRFAKAHPQCEKQAIKLFEACEADCEDFFNPGGGGGEPISLPAAA